MGRRQQRRALGAQAGFTCFPTRKMGTRCLHQQGGCGHCTSVYMQESLRKAGTATRVSAMTVGSRSSSAGGPP